MLLTVATSFVFIVWTIGFPALLGGPDSAALLHQRPLAYTRFDVASVPGRMLWLFPLLLLVLGTDGAIRVLYGHAYGRHRRVFGFLTLLWFAGCMAAVITLNLTPGGLTSSYFSLIYAGHHPLAQGGTAISIALPLLVYDGITAYCLWRMLVLARRRS